MAQKRATSHIVGSLYKFSEAAGHEIVSLFRENTTSDVSCHFNDGDFFIIHGSHNNDESLACLVNSIRNLISVEKEKELEPFEDEKIVRKGATHPSLTLAALIEEKTQAIKPSREVPLIEHEVIVRKWSPSSESKELGSKLSLQLLGRIGNLCGCRIEQASDSADLLIKADREQDIEKGILKLKRLNKMMIDEMSFPQIHSFHVLEDETSVGLQLTALSDLDDKRSVTTLLQKDLPIKSFRSLCVLVLVKGSKIVQVKLKPATSDQGSHLWNDLVSNCVQAQELIATKTPKESKNSIDKWVSEINVPDMQVDAFRPESVVKVQQSIDVGIVYKEPLSPTKKTTTKRARTARRNFEAFKESFVGSQNGHDGKEAATQEKVTSFRDYQSTRNVSTDKTSDSHHQPPSIKPPFMPPLAMPLRSLPKTPSMTSQQLIPSSSSCNLVVRDSKSGSLIDMSVPNEKRDQGNKAESEAMIVIDSLQDNTKFKARDLKYTMNQRRDSTQAFARGNTALVKSFEEASIHLLALALPRTGRIGFAVDVGRLLISHQCGSSEFNYRSSKTSGFSSVLPKGRTTCFESMITNVLTARSSEAESIVNILLSQGKRLFLQQPASRKVTYVFNCKAKGGDRIVVEFDESGDFNIQGSEILMGALDWHFPKRAWDARLLLTSERSLTTDYHRQAKGIIDNIKIGASEDGQALELWTKTIDEYLSIEAITLRRETLHTATVYPDLILHLTECQDLQVRQPSYSEGIYSGSIQSPKAMIKADRLWWEARISSINATTVLKENITLELGEIVTWTPSSIVDKGVVRDLFAAANEIVTQIDHVGFFNKGKGSSGSKTTEKPSENTQGVPASLRRVDPTFW